ncbi:equilibrative nucleotide transporter 1-like isoform X1 [Camellia sinensis]|uniref:equilibrative nucleotide transporter 1-like isoform X1 n=1 Tax=Camellia sinensis TaxID=4442 RepID=UPI001036D33C|nr:equilibrative nucleotide transporter 1-like isoform X1 [Camellia sinensis]
MSFSCNNNGGEDSETLHLLQITTNKIPKDSFNLAYTIYFTLGATFLLPWNAFITAVAYKSLGLFSLVVPVMDVVYIKGRIGLYDGFYVTVAAVAISGVGSGLVQGGIVGAAGEVYSGCRRWEWGFRRFPFPGTKGLVSNPPHYWLQCALPALYLLETLKVASGASFARLLFFRSSWVACTVLNCSEQRSE